MLQQIGYKAKEGCECYLKICTRNMRRLEHEYKIYQQMKSIQGKYVPQAFGLFRLKGTLALLLQYAGPQLDKKDMTSRTFTCFSTAIEEIHRNKVIIRDLKPAHLRFNPSTNTAMIIDFDLALCLDPNIDYDFDPQSLPYLVYPNVFAVGQFFGSTAFASIDSHLGLRAKTQGDWESFGYITDLLLDRLPWGQVETVEVTLARKVELFLSCTPLKQLILHDDTQGFKSFVARKWMPAESPTRDDLPAGGRVLHASKPEQKQPTSVFHHALSAPPNTRHSSDFQYMQASYVALATKKTPLTPGFFPEALEQTIKAATCAETEVSSLELQSSPYKGLTDAPSYVALVQHKAFDVDIWKAPPPRVWTNFTLVDTKLPQCVPVTAPPQLLIGEIKIKYTSFLLEALKYKAEQLESHLLLGTVWRDHSRFHPLYVLLDQLAGCISLNSSFKLTERDRGNFEDFLQGSPFHYPRLWLLALARKFYLHQSSSDYMQRVLQSIEPALQGMLGKPAAGALMADVNLSRNAGLHGGVSERISSLIVFWKHATNNDARKLARRLVNYWMVMPPNEFEGALLTLEVLKNEELVCYFLEQLEELFPSSGPNTD